MKNFKNCIEACLACLTTCESCITDCVASDYKECILLCRDCADICDLCARFEARGSKFRHNLHILCAEVCKACSVECENMLHTMLLVKNVLKLVKNVQLFAKNLQLLQHNFN